MESYEFPVSQRGGKRFYYWIRAEYQGKTLTILPKGEAALTEDGAYRWGYSKLPCNFDVIPLPTRTTSRATQMLKGRKLDDDGDIDNATGRYYHPNL